MTKEELNSDRINYLVWRYLQESNYRETATKLQSEWNVEDPQTLEFAPHVGNHALVAVLQRGLLYHEAERLSAQSRRGTAVLPPAAGFFGPVAPLSPPLAPEEDLANVRKRSIGERPLQARPESPAKRTKLTNGHENGIETTPMDLDEPSAVAINGITNGHAYPSPKVEVEAIDKLPIPTPIPVTTGPEKGTQVQKVVELSAETTYLTLTDASASNHPILLHCEWNPRDPNRLATAGMGTLTRLWTVPSRVASPGTDGHVPPPTFCDLLDEDENRATISAIAWTSDGDALAVASDCDGVGKINIWSKDGTRIVQFNSLGYPPIICLRWSTSNKSLLALTSIDNKGGSSYATIFTPPRQESTAFDLGPNCQPLDAQWTGESEFVLCDGKSVLSFKYADGKISKTSRYEKEEEMGPTSLAYDSHDGFLACANDDGAVKVLDANRVMNTGYRHVGIVSSLKWQTRPGPSASPGERLLASSGEDGKVFIWNTLASSKPMHIMTMDSSVLALAFTPDGDFLAAATSTHVLIWNMANPTVPAARWVRGQEPGWQSPNMNGTTLDEYHHCLSWDADGKRLAYGVNSMLAVINFKPGVAEIPAN